MKKLLLFILIVVLLIIGTIKYGTNGPSGAIAGLPTLPTAEIHKGTISSKLSGRGKITPARLIPVNSRFEGKVKELLVIEGESVKKGQCLATVSISPDFQARILQLQQKITANDLKKKQLREQLKLQKKLYKEGLAALVDIEGLEKKIEWTELEKKALRDEHFILEQKFGTALPGTDFISNAPDQTLDGCVNADIDGTVLQINKYPDDIILPEGGFGQSTLMALADLSNYFIDYNVSEIDLARVAIGQKVEIICDALPEKIFPGTIDSISQMAFYDMRGEPFIDSSREMSHYKARIRLTEDIAELRPDLSCRIDVKTATRQNVILAPITALFKENEGQSFVFVEENGHYKRRGVHVGISDADMIEILSGLNEKDIVCLDPLKILEHEKIVTASRQKTFIEKLLH